MIAYDCNRNRKIPRFYDYRLRLSGRLTFLGCDGCCRSDDGSVEQRSEIIGSDAHWQVADEIEDVVIRASALKVCYFGFG